MTSAIEGWERARALFDAARALPVPERGAFLEGACADDALRAEVHALLRAHEALEGGHRPGFLNQLDGPRTAALLEAGHGDPPLFDDLGDGQTLGRYRIVRRLARGGMGIVYLADDLRLERRAALKLLPRHLSADRAARQRFEEEARAASALDHPNVVTVYDVGDAPDGRVFIAMAFCEGSTLRELMDRGPLPIPLAVTLAIQIADGLAAAHRRGIVHRDVKPRNVIVTHEGVAKVVDFGIAAMAGSDSSRTEVTEGTVAYMSPEQTRGGSSDPATDVWGLGAVLYEMLGGRRPFQADGDRMLIHAIRSEEPSPLRALRVDVPPSLARVVARCLEKDPADRYPDAGALLSELRLLAPSSSSGPGRANGKASPRAARRAVLGRAAAILAVAAAAAVGVRASVGQPHLEPRRVAIGSIENRTGAAQLDDLASMAADWIAHGLWQTGVIEVVPLLPAAGEPASEGGGSARARAEEAGARLLVAGALYRDGDVIRLQARITDVGDGRVVGSVEPIETLAAAPMEGVDELRQRVQEALYPGLDTLIPHIRALDRPPRFEAYRAYLAGRDAHAARDLQGAIGHFRRATELDSAFALPRVITALILNMMGDYAGADAFVRELEQERESLDRFSLAHVAWLRGSLAGDRQAARAGMREAVRLAPGSTLVGYQLVAETIGMGRPREALDLLAALDPERGELRGWFGYWQVLTAAHHLLGGHRRELRAARRARDLYPDDPRALMLELDALAALGRTRQIERLVDEALARPFRGEPNHGALMLSTALELRAHAGERRGARQAAADTILERAVTWYLSRPADEQSVRQAYESTIALVASGRSTEAREALEALSAAPDDRLPGPSPFGSRRAPHFPDQVAVHGSLGVLAALEGDTAAAEAALSWLEAFTDPYAWGRPSYWRAAVLAALSRPDEAATALRRAFREGVTRSVALHKGPERAFLHDHEVLRAVTEPSG